MITIGQGHKQILYINDKLPYLPKCACAEVQKNANIWLLKITIFISRKHADFSGK